jgi:hypothetical protein
MMDMVSSMLTKIREKLYIIVPSLVTLVNISIAWIIAASPTKQAVGTGLVLLIVSPVAVFVLGLLYILVYLLPFTLRTKNIVNTIGSFAVTLPILFFVVMDDGNSITQVIDLPEQRRLFIVGENFADPCRGLSYRIETPYNVIEGVLGISCAGAHFEYITSTDRAIIGVFEYTSPNDIVLIYDVGANMARSHREISTNTERQFYRDSLGQLRTNNPAIKDFYDVSSEF